MNPSLIYIGENIRRFRKNRKWTQEELARRADISRIALIHIESGKALPTLDTLASITAVLNLPMTSLLVKPLARPEFDTAPGAGAGGSLDGDSPDLDTELQMLTDVLRSCSLHQVTALRKIIESLLATFGSR